MKEFKKILWYIAHTFVCCPDEDIDWYYKKEGKCKKCGRTYFKFNNW